MINLTFEYRKLFIVLSIGIALGLFFISGWGGFIDLPIERAGLLAFVLCIGWFLRERGKLSFGWASSALTLILIPIATFPAYFILLQSLIVFFHASLEGLALLFLGSGFFAVGYITINFSGKPERRGLHLLGLSLLFLIGVPIVNEYQIIATRHGIYWVATPYQGYTIPFILVSAAFFILGCASILHLRYQRKGLSSMDSNLAGPDSLSVKRGRSMLGRKFCPNPNTLGFVSLVLSSLSLIGAALVYAPVGPMPDVFSVPGTPLQEYTLGFILASIAFFVLGLGLVLYAKSKKLGFFSVASGSLALFAAAFAHGYTVEAIGSFGFGRDYIYNSDPFRGYTLPIVLVSVVFLVFGYALMLRKSWVMKEIRGFHDRKLIPRRLGSLSFVMVLGVAAVLIGVVAQVVGIFYPNDMLRFVAGPISIIGVGCLLAVLAGVWSRGKTSRSIRKALVGGLLLLTLSLAVVYSSAKTAETVLPPDIYVREKVQIGPVTFDSANPNTLSVNVTKVSDWNENITFSNALIRNASGEDLANVELDSFILPAPYLTEKTLTIVLNTSLPSGNYTVLLITTRGNAFISPSFTVP